MDIRKIATGLLPPLAVALLFAGWMGVKDRNGPCGFVQLAGDPPPLPPEIDDSAGPAPVIPPDNLLEAQGITELLEERRGELATRAGRLQGATVEAFRAERLGIEAVLVVIDSWLRGLRTYMEENPASRHMKDRAVARRQTAYLITEFMKSTEDVMAEAARKLESGQEDDDATAVVGCRAVFMIYLNDLEEPEQ